MEWLNQGLVDMADLAAIARKWASARGAFARWVCIKLNGALGQLFALLDLPRAELTLSGCAKRPRLNMEKNRCYANMPTDGILQLSAFHAFFVFPRHGRPANSAACG